MGSNVVVANQELLTVNDQLYGSTRLSMVVPTVAAYAGSEKNYSDGSLKNQIQKTLNYDLVQRFPDDGLAELINSVATEIAQANIHTKSFEYVRRALLVEIQYSNLDAVGKTQPRARMIAELMKKYDYLSYMGFFSNFGVDKNPNRVDQANQAVGDLGAAIKATNLGLKQLKDMGWNKNNMAEVTIAYTSTLSDKLDSVGAGREKSDMTLFMENFENARFIELPKYVNQASRIEIALRPLVTHHHASMPSLYNSYTMPNGLTEVDMFALETSTIEIEEKGAVQRIPITIS